MTTELGPNPYVGPRPFREDEQQLLFGRRTELDELTDLLYAQRIVLLHSPSGAGKSSLVAAGLLPRLRKRFQVLPIIRVNQTPPDGARAVSRFIWSAIACLDSEVRSVAADRLRTLRLADYLAQRPRDPHAPARTVLVFDQFEEVLTVDPLGLDEKKQFFAELGEVLRDEKIWALFSIREDYLGALAQFAHLLPSGLQSRYRLGFLDRDAAREAITLPAQKAGRVFVSEASEQLIRDLATQSVQQPDGSFVSQDGSYVEPVQLQVVCRRLWNRMSPDDRSVDLEDLVQLGNVSDALAEYYATSVAEVAGGDPARERAIRAWVTDKLITPDGIRGQVLQGTDESDGLANEAIFDLVDTHLVRAEKRRGATWFELAHDRLISPVRQNNEAWFESHLSELQRRAAAWDKQRRPAGLLLKGVELAEANDWARAQGSQVTPVERELLVQSQREENKTKAVQFLTFVAIAVAAVALWLFSYANSARRAAVLERNHANDAKALANKKQRELALTLGMNYWKSGRNEKSVSPLAAAHLMGLAHDLSTDDPSLRSSISIDSGPSLVRLVAVLGHNNDAVIGAVLNRDESRILTWSKDGTTRLWDLPGDLDIPHDLLRLQVEAMTGTTYDTNTQTVRVLKTAEWQAQREKWKQRAAEHYRHCKHPHKNVFRQFFPDEAAAIRPDGAKP